MTIPIAHLGHVLIDLPVFLGPVVGLASWVVWTTRRDRRRHRSD